MLQHRAPNPFILQHVVQSQGTLLSMSTSRCCSGFALHRRTSNFTPSPTPRCHSWTPTARSLFLSVSGLQLPAHESLVVAVLSSLLKMVSRGFD